MAGEYKLKQDMVEIGRRIYAKGYVASNDGNISVRLSDREILVTPTGVSKGYMSVTDMLAVDMNGNVLRGTKQATSELKMHLEVYRQRADVKAVVHAHPPVATAFAVARKTCDKVFLPEAILSLGMVSLAEYGTPSTDELPRSIAKYIGHSDAILPSNHGALTVGGDLFDAYYKMETLEHFAMITMYARLLGGEKTLDCSEVASLLKIRETVFGKPPIDIKDVCGSCVKSEAGGEPGETDPTDEKTLKETIEKLVRAELEKYMKT